MERTENYGSNGSDRSEQKQTSFPLQELKKISRVTVDQLRKYPGLETLSEEDALEVCNSFFMLSAVFYELYTQIKSK